MSLGTAKMPTLRDKQREIETARLAALEAERLEKLQADMEKEDEEEKKAIKKLSSKKK